MARLYSDVNVKTYVLNKDVKDIEVGIRKQTVSLSIKKGTKIQLDIFGNATKLCMNGVLAIITNKSYEELIKVCVKD